MKQVRVIISGDVQGVGFRAWTRAQAKNLGLAGWVKNREDGSVEATAEGDSGSLDEFVKRCQQGPQVAWVKHVDVTWSSATGEFTGFEVLY